MSHLKINFCKAIYSLWLWAVPFDLYIRSLFAPNEKISVQLILLTLELLPVWTESVNLRHFEQQ